ncbi:hypothetical protein AB0O64_32650 [Streptomyces sp. NPDC088341]|uniref:hypothetical protein n=1 Tax=Streptomyces sp. NPDC088341 TaxID=3154870 RepID=UPI00343D0145
MYRLKYDPTAEAVHDALPAAAAEALTLALAAACHEPLDATLPFGEVDDKYMRSVRTDHARAILFMGHSLRTVHVVRINYLG